ncbi:hypothetical protein AB0E70_35325 [Streptomyces murinus]|uniref:hypothetical protein n=1 Tax=Streptomyces murinus TaxID=33900 RepID=UPI000A3710D8|nr:hypothetical protein [Streptomyces murinus]
MSTIDWGDAPTWAGALFAAAAAAAAIWTLKSQRDQIDEQRDFIAEQRALIADQSATLTLERAALVDAAEDRKRAQAEGVTWDTSGWFEILANYSNAPITNVRLEHPSEPVEVGTVFEGAASLTGIGLDPIEMPCSVLGIGRRLGCERPQGSNETIFATFTDDAGVRWRLDEHGKLEEIPSAP